MRSPTTDKITAQLWVIVTKLEGIGSLLNCYNGEPLRGEGAAYGLGSILFDLADELQSIRELLEYGPPDDETKSD